MAIAGNTTLPYHTCHGSITSSAGECSAGEVWDDPLGGWSDAASSHSCSVALFATLGHGSGAFNSPAPSIVERYLSADSIKDLASSAISLPSRRMKNWWRIAMWGFGIESLS
jgi:hypothetical protein